MNAISINLYQYQVSDNPEPAYFGKCFIIPTHYHRLGDCKERDYSRKYVSCFPGYPVNEMPVYLPILAEDHRRLIAGILESEYRSLLGNTTETPEVNDRFLRLHVLLFVLNTKAIQSPFQFFTIRAVLQGVDYYCAHFFTVI